MPQGTTPRPETMDRMVRRFGINLATAGRAGMGRQVETVAATCRDCPAIDRCRAWLDAAPAGAVAPSFCPNAGQLALIAGYTQHWRIAAE